jgi:hypothetical protein
MMVRQAQTSERRAMLRFAPAQPRTVSRANPPFVRNLPHHARANARFSWENRHQHGNPASSGSVVANDPVNEEDPSGMCPMCLLIIPEIPEIIAAVGAGIEALEAAGVADTAITATARAAGLQPGVPTKMKCYIVTKPSC